MENNHRNVLYEDRWITCTDKELVIRGYYFPFGWAKRIPYAELVAVHPVDMGITAARARKRR